MQHYNMNQHKSVTFVRKMWDAFEKYGKPFFKVVFWMAIAYGVFQLCIWVNESPEMYMFRNWGTMRSFATLHKEYRDTADAKAKEDALQDFTESLVE